MKKYLCFMFLCGLSINLSASTYQGSSFDEVLKVIADQGLTLDSQQAQDEFDIYQRGVLPQYMVTLKTVMQGPTTLERDAVRTIVERFDYYDRIAKKLHPNGVCVKGKWTINQSSPYTGYFASGSQALFIGRVSVAMSDTKNNKKRGFGLAGKLFPTKNELKVVETVNFFTVDTLLGTNTPRFLDSVVTNEPELGITISPSILRLGLFISKALGKADENPLFRPVTPIAKLGVPAGESIVSPRWMRVSAKAGQVKNNSADFT